MSDYERMRRNGVSPERLAAIGLEPRATVAATSAPDLESASADLDAYRTWLAANPFERFKVFQALGAAIERGRAIDQSLPINENK